MANLTFEQAKHLVVRTGYGPELEKIYRYQHMSQHEAIENLLNTPRNLTTPPPKFTTNQQLRRLRGDNKKLEAQKLFRKDSNRLRHWGLMHAILSHNSLHERMVWFWHNHFTSSVQRSQRTVNLMLMHDLSIRKNAMGNFGTLLKDMSYDPMMLIYLDGVSNKKGKPNENFARELLELFTLGEGHYTENDIKEVSRAFSGWIVNGSPQQAKFNKKQFDQGLKRIFGQAGNFTSDDVLNLLLRNPRTAEFIAEKLWKEFINLEQPDNRTIVNWGKILRDNNYEITPVLRAILNSQAFWSQNNSAKLIKSPLDLVVGTLRSLDLEDKNLPLGSLTAQLKKMGQDLYAPPNVKGWPGGEVWIDDTTLLVRQQFLRNLTRGSGNQQSNMKNMMSMKKNNMPATDIPQLPPAQWESWLLPIKSVTTIHQQSPRERLQAILLDPTYQLK